MRPMIARAGRLLKIGVVCGLVLGAVRVVLGRRRPPVTGEASWPTLADQATQGAKPDAPPEPTGSEPAKAATAARPAESSADESAWVEPTDGVCPTSHPVKGNADSGIYHVPGGASYERTVAERCYLSKAAAEADGFRAAKR